MTQIFKMWLCFFQQIIVMVCIKFSFSFIKTTARAATTFLINQWLAMAAEWRKD
jgi:hypothetical protein